MSVFVCPVCRGGLNASDEMLRCAQGHAFDLAKEGYVNLLLAAARKSKDPGYNKAMIASRHTLFESGHYQHLADAMAGIVARNLPEDRITFVLDAGCGEGYYLRRIRAHTTTTQPSLSLIGVDVSKHGVRIASRGDRLGEYAVASTHDLPLGDNSVDVLLTHFSPVFAGEFHRVVKPGGVVVVGAPGPRHLFGLKELVYDNAEQHTPSDPLDGAPGYELAATDSVQYTLEIDNRDAIAALFAMTPFYWSANHETQARIATLDQLHTEVDVIAYSYRVVK